MITALVLYDLPAHIDHEACRQHFLKIAPDFLGVPGFIRKQFIHDVNGGAAGPHRTKAARCENCSPSFSDAA